MSEDQQPVLTQEQRQQLEDLAKEVFGEFSNSELVLIGLAFNSGARFKAGILEAGLAEKLTAVGVDLLTQEMRRREVDINRLGTGLMRRLLDALMDISSKLPE
jgi:hypothetical protein